MPPTIDQRRANDIKQRLYERKLTLKAWAIANGYQYHTVSNVMRGVNKASFGAGREVAEKLLAL